jgi:hypothetical protein
MLKTRHTEQSLMWLLRQAMIGSRQSGRWLCARGFHAVESTDDEPQDQEKLPPGYYDEDLPFDEHEAIYPSFDTEADEKLPDYPEGIEEYIAKAKAVSNLVLVRREDGTLDWLQPARWEAYNLEDQTDQLEWSAKLMEAAANCIGELLLLLGLNPNAETKK